jgi:tetratricopeptide (TPR) repeat protein
MNVCFTIGSALIMALALPVGLLRPVSTPLDGQEKAVTTAIEHIRNLEYAEAEEQLRHFLTADSTNLRAWNYLAIAILYEEMFKRGVLESRVYGQGGDVFKPSKVAVTPEFQQELLKTLEKAQAVAEQRLKSDSSDQDAMYWAGVSHGTRATYHFVLRKEYKPALHEATEAYNYHRNLLKLNPRYIDAYLIVGMNNYVVGSLPWYIKVLTALTGRHGNRAEGLQQMKRAEQEGHYAREDARLMLAVLYQREKRYAEALPLYQEMARSYPRNYLLQGEVAALFALLNNWNSAASTYDSMLNKHRTGEAGYHQIPLARVLYQSGQDYERLQENELALARYEEAGGLPGSNHYTYLSELAAADLLMHLQRENEARKHYERIVGAVPQSQQGKLAKRALAKLSAH